MAGHETPHSPQSSPAPLRPRKISRSQGLATASPEASWHSLCPWEVMARGHAGFVGGKMGPRNQHSSNLPQQQCQPGVSSQSWGPGWGKQRKQSQTPKMKCAPGPYPHLQGSASIPPTPLPCAPLLSPVPHSRKFPALRMDSTLSKHSSSQ